MTSLGLLQAAYFVLTGVWPLVHMRSFLKVTGPKTDLWLVKTVGLLVTVIGLAIAASVTAGTTLIPLSILAIGSAAALAIIDVVYVTRRTIARIYLLDAAVEIILIGVWGALLMSQS
jgi:hypothetical protein